MKAIFTFILFFTLILNSYAQEWNVLNEGFTGRDIDFINENVGWIIGDGKILKTEDGGVTWYSYPTDNNRHFDKIDFIDESTGWACVDTTIIYSDTDTHPAATIHKTEDGGQNWFIQAPGREFPLGDKVLHAVNDSVVYLSSYEYIGGPNNDDELYILKTVDGGETWNDIYYNEDRIFNTIQFLDSENGICIGALLDPVFTNPYRGFILRTNNGGQTWREKQVTQFSNIYDFKLVNDSTGYFVGWLSANDYRDETYYICRTEDFLNTWSVVYQTESFSFNSLYCLDETNLFAVVTDTNWTTHFIKSNDGGITWVETQNNGWLWNRGKTHFLNENDGMVVVKSSGNNWGVNLILETEDGGNNWHYKHFSYDLYDIQLLNENEGFIHGYQEQFHGGSWDYISKITEGGNFQINFDGELFYFLDDRTGFLLSDEYDYPLSCFKTNDGGINWKQVEVSDLDSVRFDGNDLYFLYDNKGWIVGSGIYETTDGGEQWNLIRTFPDTGDNLLSLYSVHGCDTSAWAVGEQGLIVKYTPQNQWQQHSSVTDLPLTDVFFSDTDHGWIAGGYQNDQGFQSILLMTNNSGETWIEKRFEKYLINDMYFEGSLHGYVVGCDTSWQGIILETFDGGENWIPVAEKLSVPLNAIDFKDGIGWAVGGKGLILKTDDGSTWIDQTTGEKFPANYSLSQNYPNPFNPNTMINYQLPARSAGGPMTSDVELSIYNLLGQKVATLVNKKQPSGSYQVQWDASGFSTGVYLYRLRVSDPSSGSGKIFVETKKLILLK